jgi:hypothetical protein
VPNIIRGIKPTIIRWAGHVAHMRVIRHKKYLSENLMGSGHLEDETIKLKLILMEQEIRTRTGFSGLRTGSNGGSLKTC